MHSIGAVSSCFCRLELWVNKFQSPPNLTTKDPQNCLGRGISSLPLSWEPNAIILLFAVVAIGLRAQVPL